MKNKDLAIYGPYPPPLGGVSVHLYRIEYYLEKSKIDYTIFNFGSLKKERVIPTNKSIFWYLKILFNKNFRIFHFHQIFYFEFFFYYVFSIVNRTPSLVSIHGERLLTTTVLLRNLSLFFLKKSKLDVITVSKNLYDLLVSKNINAVFLPAYVPPVNVNFTPIKKDGRIYFLYSIWKLSKKLSEKIYNVPLAFQFLKENKEKYKMLFLVGNYNISDAEYLEKLISEYDLHNHVEVFWEKNLVDYVQNCSFLLKTNKVDGYGVALQEAMDLGVPAIATDVCIRPKGTIIFKNDDIEDLTKKVEHTVSQPLNDALKDREDLQYHLELIRIYKNLLNKQ